MIPQHQRAPCYYCKQELDSEALGTAQWTGGWVIKRRQGGGNAVALPQRQLIWACRYCVDRAIRGEIGQGGLFEAPAMPPPPPTPPPPTNAHFDQQGRFIHDTCAGCGAIGASFGVGVSLRKNKLGLWYCGRCYAKTIDRPAGDLPV